MKVFSGVVYGLVTLVFVAQPSFQCTCDWGRGVVNQENVPNKLCHDGQTYIVFKADGMTFIPGNINTGRVEFSVMVTKVITKEKGEEDIPGGKRIILDAATGSHLCGYISFKRGVSGILSVRGPLQDKMGYNACSYYKRESEVTPTERLLMSGGLSCEQSYN